METKQTPETSNLEAQLLAEFEAFKAANDERMAEDVLRFSGFVEGINYIKQRAIETTIPDFAFFLPKDKTPLSIKG